MPVHDLPTLSDDRTTRLQPDRDPDAEVVSFLAGRSAPCPRCGYDLRDIKSAKCPECGEPLVLKIGTPRARFGWLLLAVAPGSFSGVAAVFVLVPIVASVLRRFLYGSAANLPWPIIAADAFGFLSAISVVVIYRHRQRFMAWRSRRQALFAISVWGVHVLMFGLFLLAMWLWN